MYAILAATYGLKLKDFKGQQSNEQETFVKTKLAKINKGISESRIPLLQFFVLKY